MSTDHAYVIVPYRARGKETARKEQLDNLTIHLRAFFADASLEYTIIVVEQDDDTGFNRGRLLNIGTIEAKNMFKAGERNIIIHWNVDVLAGKIDFRTFSPGLTNVCGWWDGSGSLCVMDIENYYLANGFPNNLSGWGAEDHALKNRCMYANVPFHIYEHHNDPVFAAEIENGNPFGEERAPGHWATNAKNSEIVRQDFLLGTWRTNGVSSCTYTVTSKQFDPSLHYYHIKAIWKIENGWNSSTGRINFTSV